MAGNTPRRRGDGATGDTARLFDRQPPHNVEAERSVLGAALINSQAVGQAVEVLGEAETDLFYIPAHQHVYNAAVSLFKRSIPADPVTVTEELTRRGLLDGIGGITFVAELCNAAPTSANVEHYAKIVLDTALTRRLISTCVRVSGAAYERDQDVEELLETAEQEIFQINEKRHASPIYWVGNLVNESFKALEERIRNKGVVSGVQIGFPDLDKLLSGLQSGDMVVLAARPSVGKTAFALNIAAHTALKEKTGVLLFSLEMSKEQLMQRLLCLVGHVDMQRVRDGFLSNDEIPKVQKAAGELMNAQLYFDESGGLTPLELRARARRHKAQHPDLGLIIIDYMQLMTVGRRVENRQVEISEISRSIKGLARELSVPVMALSQMSREAEKDDEGEPKLSHLRESGAIEQDADVVMILARPPKKDRELKPDTITVHVSKHRNGPTGNVELIFRRNMQQFLPTGGRDYRGAPSYNAPPPDDEPVHYEEDDVAF